MSKITHKEAEYSLRSLVAKFVIPSVEETSYGALYDYSHFYNILNDNENQHLKNVEDYINQQEKQEKLLELYKELIIELDLELEEFERFGDKAKNPALDKLRIKNANFVFEGNASSLFKQIKELENDL